ncbi:kinesin-like protein KIF18B isoform X2 [Alligator mississippiensis]|uniref:kinesin-like protein KIF18B isoform X2 n=1 Tax=Alligator mississippiensis TaxID=8496 RepID=UPI0009074644|nr:kinesin-like protein KIF18B isoform X2 [Alligator mississippiensis]
MASVPPPEEGSVTVVVRVRPQNQREQEGNQHSTVRVVDDRMLVFDPEEPCLLGVFMGFRGHDAPKRKGKDLKFMFDRVFSEHATQEEVFQHTTKEILDGVLNGYNCSVFAYGATGAGKTYTMLGSEKSPGIMYLTMVELYKRIEARKDEKNCEVLISYQEVYNEQIHDLLEPKGPLAIREDPEKGVVVQGLSFHQPKSAKQLLEMLANGNKNRTQHPTDVNATSSRSHAVFQIYVKQQDRVVGIAQDLQVAKMSLIDLAGSERASAANTKGERLREGANINRSLLALINVINALADTKSKKPHIPYRDSKLTRLLKDSIGGNCRTIMIAAITPSTLAYEDTYNTLKYASRAKEIKMSLKSNILSLDCHFSNYAVICEQLKAEVMCLTGGLMGGFVLVIARRQHCSGTVAALRAKLQTYERDAQVADQQVPASLAHCSPHQAELLRSDEAAQEVCSNDEALCKGAQGMMTQQQELNIKPSFQQQELGTAEEASEKKPCSCMEFQSTDTQQKTQGENPLLQGLTSTQTERLVTTILHVAQKQFSLLKAANLLTPDMISEFEELEHLVHGKTSRHQEQVRTLDRSNETSQAQETGQHSDNVPSGQDVSVTEHSTPMTRSAARRLQELMLLPNPSLKTFNMPTKKRRRSEMSSPSKSGTPPTLKRQAKRQRKSSLSGLNSSSIEQVAFPTEMHSHSTPLPKEVKPSLFPDYHIPKCCPSTVIKSRVPLAVSTTQNCCSPSAVTIRDLNMTFDLSEDSCSSGLTKPIKFSAPQFPGWENVQCLMNKPDVPLMPRPSVPVFIMKGSSIPRGSITKPSSSVSKVSGQKRRHSVSTASRSLGGLQSQSRIARLQSNTRKSLQTPSVPEHPSCSFAWRGSKTSKKELIPVSGNVLAGPRP